MKKKCTISGIVINKENKQPLIHLRIEAGDVDFIVDDLLGSAMTDAEGKFSIESDEKYFSELVLDRNPDLFFRIYDDRSLIHATCSSAIR